MASPLRSTKSKHRVCRVAQVIGKALLPFDYSEDKQHSIDKIDQW